jgi:ketosteroid isomerase-like protein
MNDRQQIEQLYQRMYRAMVEKDIATLDSLHAREFVFTHMTGMRQTKQQYLGALPMAR